MLRQKFIYFPFGKFDEFRQIHLNNEFALASLFVDRPRELHRYIFAAGLFALERKLAQFHDCPAFVKE
jgi:hypothetical protein